MSTLEITNVVTGETAAMLPDTDRAIADKIVATLRRNGQAAGERGAMAWTIIEHDQPDEGK
jgi:hypothetical protein